MDIEYLLFPLFLLILASLICSPILAILAFRRAGRAEARMREWINATPPKPVAPAAASPAITPAVPRSVPSARQPVDRAPAVVPVAAPPPLPTPPTATAQTAPGHTGTLESQIGVRVAGWIGVALLLLGGGFFVTYAIQNAWLSPSMRVMLGVLGGAALVMIGHVMERKSYPLLARMLTAGGGGLAYFSVYAARGVYKLIGAPAAFGGLLAVALIVLALSVLYRNQWIALGSLLAAYFVPVLTSSGTRDGIFLLGYIAVLNLPVMALGLQRRWQMLYNTDAVLAWLAWFGAVGENLNGLGSHAVAARLIFAGIFFAQFTCLHMIKLWRETVARRPLDLARLSLNSLAMLTAVYMTLKDGGQERWTGLAMILGAVGHLALAAAARRRLPLFTDDALAFLVCAATFAALALPLQLDGAWVSAGWAVEGALLAWFASRIGSPVLRVVGLGVTALGWGKSLVYDPSLYDTPPRLFFNGRFGAGALAALSFAVQARWTSGAAPSAERERTAGDWIAAIALFAAAIAVVWECAFVWPGNNPASAAIGSLAVATIAAFAFRSAAPGAVLRGAALALLILACVKMLTWDAWVIRHAAQTWRWMWNLHLPGLLVSSALIGWAAGGGRDRSAAALHILAIASAILVITAEIDRGTGPWRGAVITLFWSASALAVVGFGLVRRRRYLRWTGLILLGLAVLKTLLVDLANLPDLPRIAAFFGAGALMLLLSFVYQRLSRNMESPDGKGAV
ncbi:MAG: DUF2339 domain-containing protein [Kiritimatiellae bacterium]|nr:DUF2339 domain-containing protein [Kiritimatiellia bacterium]